MNDKKISNFPGRRSEVATAVASVIATGTTTKLGGDQGDFKREPCGTCVSWRRISLPGAPLNSGQCMFAPMVPLPAYDQHMRPIGQLLVRPQPPADAEGCDQHDDGIEDDEPPAARVSVG